MLLAHKLATSSKSNQSTTDSSSSSYSLQKHHYVPQPISPVALDRYERSFSTKSSESSGGKVARVMYDFQAMAKNELAVKKGDLVSVRKNINQQWVEVEDCSSGLVVNII